MNVRFEGLHHSFVARVPDSQRLIVGRADDKLAARMEDDASYPVVVSDESKEAHPGADVPHANHLVSRARREEGSFVRAFVVRSGRRVDRRSCALRRPRDAFHHVIVISELDLTVGENSLVLQIINATIVAKSRWNAYSNRQEKKKETCLIKLTCTVLYFAKCLFELPSSPSSPRATRERFDRSSSWR